MMVEMETVGVVAAEKVEVVVAHDEANPARGRRVRQGRRRSDSHRRRGRGDGDRTGPDSADPLAKAACAPLAALPGTALGHLGESSTASAAAWAAAGAAVRTLHDAPLPPWPGLSVDDLVLRLADESEWLIANDVLPADVVTRNRRLAETALRPWTPVFIHGDLQVDHVFVDGDEVTGIIDWSEASQGDALFDLAILTLGHPEHLGDVIAGYGTDVDRDLIRAWYSMRCLTNMRWLSEHGYGTPERFPEVAVLRSQSEAARDREGGWTTARRRRRHREPPPPPFGRRLRRVRERNGASEVIEVHRGAKARGGTTPTVLASRV